MNDPSSDSLSQEGNNESGLHIERKKSDLADGLGSDIARTHPIDL